MSRPGREKLHRRNDDRPRKRYPDNKRPVAGRALRIIKSKSRKVVNEDTYMDYNLLFIVIFLLAFGLVMVYSASSYEAMLKMGDAAFYFKKQLFATALGIVVMLIVTFVDYHFWRLFSVWMFLGSLISVLLVKTALGKSANGATRWLNIAGFSVQPAEIVKLAIIIFLASLIAKMGSVKLADFKTAMKVFLIAVVAGGEIYIVTSNLSSAIIVVGIAFLMMFVASPDSRVYIIMVVAAVVIAALTIYIITAGSMAEGGGSFRAGRIRAWLNPEAYASSIGFQTLQALYAIGSGGFKGKGLGQSMQKLDFLPEAQNDMIFSIICEEFGIIIATAIIAIFLFLIWRCVIIASNAPDLYGSLLAVGIMAHISLQVIFNVAVVTNTIPNTGITLPFISYGGTSVVFLLFEMGLLLSVSRRINFE